MAKAKKEKVVINLNADLTGFASASRPSLSHEKIAGRFASPFLGGPPKNRDLMDLMAHMFTDEEADLVQHLPLFRPRTVEKVAALAGRSVEESRRVLDNLAFRKRIVLASGNPRKFTLLPIVPGTFEMCLMTPDVTTLTEWHREFARIFERVWDTGFMADYQKRAFPVVRYLPVATAELPGKAVWPSERLAEILDQYDTFALGACQCRVAMHFADKGCGRKLDACAVFGPAALPIIERGMMRRVDKAEVLAAKIEAEKQGCVTFVANAVGDPRGNGSCSCCGDCCHALRMITELSAPRAIAPPRFLPLLDEKKCNRCRVCQRVCPMGAWSGTGDQRSFDRARCIGCGLCVVHCKTQALTLSAAEKVRGPEKSYAALLARMLPGYLYNAGRVTLARALSRKG